MGVLDKYRKIDPVNKKYFTDYLRYLQLRNIKSTTIDTKFWKIYGFLLWSEFRDAKEVLPEDLENFYLHRKETKSPVTAYGDLQELEIFFRWLLPDRKVITFKPQRPRVEISPEKIPQAQDIRDILAVCQTQRDRALVATYWNSGGRLSELLDANVGNVQFDRYGAIISVDGKTGKRQIRLVSAVPDLQLWLSRFHPYKNDPNAPLFVTSRERGSGKYVRLNARTVQNLFKRLGVRAGLSGKGKKTNPHAYRHGCATNRAKDMTEAELREYFGWSKGSTMASVYVHLSGRDIDNKVLAIDGVKLEEDQDPDPMLPLECPRCSRRNAPDAILCDRCSMALTDEALKFMDGVQALRNDPETLIEFGEWLMKKNKAGKT